VDTRAKQIVMTKAGVEKTRSAVRLVEHFDVQFFNGLGKEQPGLNARLQSLLRLNQQG
jgi:hypothetical protein